MIVQPLGVDPTGSEAPQPAGGKPCTQSRSTAIVDESKLRELRQHVGDEPVDRFITDFSSLLDDRLTELDVMIAEDRTEDSVTRLLTIATSSTMLGAEEVAVAATALIQVLDPRQPDLIAMRYAELTAAVRDLRGWLDRFTR